MSCKDLSIDNFSMRELYKMGLFNLPTTTMSGRISKIPTRYSEETFTKGSGCCSKPKCDPTDMSYNGEICSDDE